MCRAVGEQSLFCIVNSWHACKVSQCCIDRCFRILLLFPDISQTIQLRLLSSFLLEGITLWTISSPSPSLLLIKSFYQWRCRSLMSLFCNAQSETTCRHYLWGVRFWWSNLHFHPLLCILVKVDGKKTPKNLIHERPDSRCLYVLVLGCCYKMWLDKQLCFFPPTNSNTIKPFFVYNVAGIDMITSPLFSITSLSSISVCMFTLSLYPWIQYFFLQRTYTMQHWYKMTKWRVRALYLPCLLLLWCFTPVPRLIVPHMAEQSRIMHVRLSRMSRQFGKKSFPTLSVQQLNLFTTDFANFLLLSFGRWDQVWCIAVSNRLLSMSVIPSIPTGISKEGSIALEGHAGK